MPAPWEKAAGGDAQIVAREFGLPGVQRRLRTGQRLRVDGGRGTVTVLPGSPGPR
jgi:hypothetical protein